MSNVSTDIDIASSIIKNGYKTNKTYHDSSFIFLTTNENVNLYKNYLNNKEKTLSVIASGDQVLNTCLFDSTNIDAFDISVFPKYLLELKKTAIINLELDDYKKFIFEDNFKDEEYMDDIYFSINKYLDKDSKKFWDYFFNFYEYNDVFKSPLFSSQYINLKTIINNNPYLEEENYKVLQTKLGQSNINYYDGDIRSLSSKLKNNYDLVNLSSIIYYESNYKEILTNTSLNEDGVILTYLYKYDEEFSKGYSECTFDRFKDKDESIMVYQKTK